MRFEEKGLHMQKVMTLAMALTLSSGSAAVLAHHSTAMYDAEHPVTISGTVKRFEWTNPHAHVYLTVDDPNGKQQEWDVELMSLNHLRSYGWMKTTIKPGDKLTVSGIPARSGDPAMIANTIALPDGTKIKS